MNFMRHWIDALVQLNEANLTKANGVSRPSQSTPAQEYRTTIPASKLMPYVVHNASGDIDPARQEINSDLRTSIEENGVRDAVLLDIDTARDQARLANGNHRVVMANEIDPTMMIPTIIRSRGDWKRPLTSAKPYGGEFVKRS